MIAPQTVVIPAATTNTQSPSHEVNVIALLGVAAPVNAAGVLLLPAVPLDADPDPEPEPALPPPPCTADVEEGKGAMAVVVEGLVKTIVR